MLPNWEVRAAGDVQADGRVLRAYPIVFNRLSEDLGGFREIVLPEAVDRTLRERLDVRALVDHSDDPTRVIGRVSAGTLRLAKDARGLAAEIDVPETTFGNDALALVRRGDVTGMSFAFRVVRPHGERVEQRDGQRVSLLSDLIIRDINLVTYPAYPDAVAARAIGSPAGQRIDWLRRRLQVR